MAKLWEKHIHDKLKELEKYLLKKYKEEHPQREIDYAEYEKELKKRFRNAMRELPSLIEKATTNLKFYRGRGDKPSLKIDQRIRLLLISQLAGKSNRMMAYMTELFSAITGINKSYKTIERLYSDKEIEIALFNLWTLLLKRKNVNKSDCCGDATGFGLFISKHYSSYVQKLKDKAKESENTKKAFVYKFSLMDLSTRMYVCSGTSLISERKAFNKAMQMLSNSIILLMFFLPISLDYIILNLLYPSNLYFSLFHLQLFYILSLAFQLSRICLLIHSKLYLLSCLNILCRFLSSFPNLLYNQYNCRY